MDATNKIDYLEFSAADLQATKDFFATVFYWKFTDYGPDYIAFEDGRLNGGFFRASGCSTTAAGGALPVIYHSKLEETRQRVIDAGGKIVRDIFSFPGGRRFHFAEPSGNEFAVWSE